MAPTACSLFLLWSWAAVGRAPSCPSWCASFECDGSAWCQHGETPFPCRSCTTTADGDDAEGAGAKDVCFDASCTDVGADCCAPPSLNEAMSCSNGLRPVRTNRPCFGFADGQFSCCGRQPTTTLRNGVEMPKVILGAGGSTWMDDDRTDVMVYQALKNGGFRGVDTANHYRNHAGVARGVASAYRDGYVGDVWLQSKIEGCGNSVDRRSPVLRGSCREDTLARLDDDMRALQVR